MLVQPKVSPKTSVDAGRLGKSDTPTVPTPKESGAIADASYAIGASMPGVQDAKNAAAAFQTQAGPVETQIAEILASVQKDISGVAGKSARQAELMKSEGVNANKELLNTYTKQLEQEQRNLKKTTDAINNGELGFMTAGYANKKLQDIQRQSLSRQADIAILANAAQGNISTAMDLVDQKLQIEYGERENRIALQKQYLDMVSPLLSAENKRIADQRAIEVSLYSDKLAAERETARMEYQAKLQRQNAAYEASLQPTGAGSYGVSTQTGSSALQNADLGINNIASLTGGSTQKGRDAAASDLINAYQTGGTPAMLDLARSRFVSTRDAKEQNAYDAAEDALQQYGEIKNFLKENPDFDISYAKKALYEASGYFGKQDPKTTEFLSLVNNFDSKLRVVDTGLSLTGFELNDSQKRFYSNKDTVDTYLTKADVLVNDMTNKLSNKYDRGIGAGFYQAYQQTKPYLQEQTASIDSGDSVYDSFLTGQNL
jgi:hypothetical protein